MVVVVTLAMEGADEALLAGLWACAASTLCRSRTRAVMGGPVPLRQLADAGILEQRAVVFARHRGLGLLLKRDLADIGDVESFRARAPRIVLASDTEAPQPPRRDPHSSRGECRSPAGHI
jgi:hypothetical protein